MSEKPTGQFQCLVCKQVWSGEQLYQDPQSIGVVWTCGDLFCGARVVPIDPSTEIHNILLHSR